MDIHRNYLVMLYNLFVVMFLIATVDGKDTSSYEESKEHSENKLITPQDSISEVISTTLLPKLQVSPPELNSEVNNSVRRRKLSQTKLMSFAKSRNLVERQKPSTEEPSSGKVTKTTTSVPKAIVSRQTEILDPTLLMFEEEWPESRFVIALLPSKTLIDNYGNGSTPPQPMDR